MGSILQHSFFFFFFGLYTFCLQNGVLHVAQTEAYQRPVQVLILYELRSYIHFTFLTTMPHVLSLLFLSTVTVHP